MTVYLEPKHVLLHKQQLVQLVTLPFQEYVLPVQAPQPHVLLDVQPSVSFLQEPHVFHVEHKLLPVLQPQLPPPVMPDIIWHLEFVQPVPPEHQHVPQQPSKLVQLDISKQQSALSLPVPLVELMLLHVHQLPLQLHVKQITIYQQQLLVKPVV